MYATVPKIAPPRRKPARKSTPPPPLLSLHKGGNKSLHNLPSQEINKHKCYEQISTLLS